MAPVSLPVLVVGAGPAGLAAMCALRAAEVAFDAVERLIRRQWERQGFDVRIRAPLLLRQPVVGE